MKKLATVSKNNDNKISDMIDQLEKDIQLSCPDWLIAELARSAYSNDNSHGKSKSPDTCIDPFLDVV